MQCNAKQQTPNQRIKKKIIIKIKPTTTNDVEKKTFTLGACDRSLRNMELNDAHTVNFNTLTI